MASASKSRPSSAVTRHVAFVALAKSVVINMITPAVLYKLAAPHFAAASLAPLAISGLPPILWLAYSIVRLRSIDFLGLFAAENVAVAMGALLLAHTEREALIGRAMQNVILVALFLGSLALRKPLMLHMTRQLITGNDPSKREAFDAAAEQPGALHTFRVLTIGWSVALLIKALGSYYLGVHFQTTDYLIVSPLWDLVSDTVLVTCSLLYGRAKLAPPASIDAVA